jgi:hypothetical protein
MVRRNASRSPVVDTYRVQPGFRLGLGTHVAWCPEIPGIFGRGRTKMAALVDLREGVSQSLKDRRERGVRDAPKGAVFDTISVE